MPWTSRDAKRHTKKASTPKKKRQFAHVANSILEATGDEGRAIRGANAAVKKKAKRKSAKRKVPKYRDTEDRGPKTDQTERRNKLVTELEARKYAEIIGESVKARVHKYFHMDFLATQMNDHTRSLSERVTELENTLGTLRDQCRRAEMVWQKVGGAIYGTTSGEPKDYGRE